MNRIDLKEKSGNGVSYPRSSVVLWGGSQKYILSNSVKLQLLC